MNLNTATSRLASLLGSASLLTMSNAIAVHAQQVAQAEAQAAPEEVPENILITGSLIRGTVAVGVPVVNLGPMDFAKTGAVSVSDLFRNIPEFNTSVGGGVGTVAAGRAEGGTRVNLRQLDTGTAPRNLMMIDGMRYPPQDQGLCQIEPDVIPVVAIDRIDLLLDGASATYGSDAIGGVFNIILKRAYDGAITQVGFKTGHAGNQQYYASQLWGRTWDGGDITLSWEWRDTGATRGKVSSRYTFDFSPWGLDNRTPLGSSLPGTISTGATANTNDPTCATASGCQFYNSQQGHNCTNCFAIPQGAGQDFVPGATGVGPTAPFSASTLNWASFNNPANRGTNGTRNEFNPYSIVDYSADIKFTGGAVTVDQRLTKDISFYGEGFYGMRRARIENQANANQFSAFAVPTTNPYYPTGGAPTNLRVSYHISVESPSISSGGEVAQRYQGGLNIALPAEWAAKLSYSMTRDSNWVSTVGSVNKAAVSAALGWTMPATPAAGTSPLIGTFSKPSNVPYLNLFCDPFVFQCNSPTTLNYIGNFARSDEAFWVNQKTLNFDGPLFDLPGGTVKAAVGADYTSNKYIITQLQQAATNTLVALQNDPQGRDVWAVYGQVNVPVFSDMNAILGFRRLDFEASWRHDQYSDFGGTSNTKVGFNWSPIEDFTIRGGWGTSFRAPNFGENSLLVNAAYNAFGLPAAVFANNAVINVACDPTTNRPLPGSGAAKLFAAGFACNSQPGGFSFNGGAKGPNVAGWRNYVNTDGQVLQPEKSNNWAIGFDYAPSMNFLKGFDIAATWYSIKINGLLVGFGNPTTGRFGDATLGFAYLVPSDLRNPNVGARGFDPNFAVGQQLCPGMDATPWLCAPFQSMISSAIPLPNNTVPGTAQTLIYWLNDGGTFNRGWQKNEGVDYSVSYDWDMGNIGAFNVGMTGTYYTHLFTQRVPGAPVVDGYDDTLPAVNGVQMNGVNSLVRPRAKSRSRIGWSNGPWDATVFMNYSGHFFHTQSAPPNVNAGCLTTGGTIGGGTLPCFIQGYESIVPSYYTFDLSFGYDTGEDPANEYLRNVSIQLTIDNFLDKHPPFEYRISTGGGNPSAFDILQNIYGRIIGVRLTKTW